MHIWFEQFLTENTLHITFNVKQYELMIDNEDSREQVIEKLIEFAVEIEKNHQ